MDTDSDFYICTTLYARDLSTERKYGKIKLHRVPEECTLMQCNLTFPPVAN